MMKRLQWARRSALVLALVGATMPAHADDKSDARALFTEATRHYDLNDFSRALTLFRQAYLKHEDPVFLFNIGQCERQLGDKVAAVKSYRSYLRKAPDAPNRESVRRLIAQLDGAIAQEAAAQHSPPEEALHSTSSPTGTTSREPGTTPALTPAGGATTVPTEALTATAPARKPVYKKAWFWGVVGGAAAVVVVGVTVGVLVGGGTHDPSAPSIGVVQ